MTASEDLADRFHAAMLSGDTEILNSILSDDVTFTGPMATSSGRDDTVAGIVQMSKMTKGDEVLVRLTDDQNALIWSQITTAAGPATPAATSGSRSPATGSPRSGRSSAPVAERRLPGLGG